MSSSAPPSLELAKPARYFPLEKGIYDLGPGLRPLTTSFGNGAADQRVFQIDGEFRAYRKNKLDNRAERLEKYVQFAGFTPEIARAAAAFIAKRLAQEHPDLFALATGESHELRCALTAETLGFDADWRLTGARTAPQPAYACAFDALCSQVQEDVAVIARGADGKDRLCFSSVLTSSTANRFAATRASGCCCARRWSR